MFSTKGVNTQDSKKVSKYFSYGIHQLFIFGIEVKTASTGSKQLTFLMETPPVTADGFEAEAGHKGQVGRVAFPGSFIKLEDSKAVEEFNKNIGIIADKLGVRKQLDDISAPDFDSYVEKIAPLFANKPAWWAIAGEEYLKNDGKTGVRLKTRRYSFVASMSEGKDHLEKFDASKSYNFKPVVKPDADSIPATGVANDLPF
jgi:hypothetical protein